MVHKKGGGKGWGTYYKYYYLGIQTIFYTYTTNLLSIQNVKEVKKLWLYMYRY